MSLEELQVKYGPRCHLPDPNCKRCNGSGERVASRSHSKREVLPCICLFIPRKK